MQNATKVWLIWNVSLCKKYKQYYLGIELIMLNRFGGQYWCSLRLYSLKCRSIFHLWHCLSNNSYNSKLSEIKCVVRNNLVNFSTLGHVLYNVYCVITICVYLVKQYKMWWLTLSLAHGSMSLSCSKQWNGQVHSNIFKNWANIMLLAISD